jgi:hypothetical protein
VPGWGGTRGRGGAGAAETAVPRPVPARLRAAGPGLILPCSADIAGLLAGASTLAWSVIAAGVLFGRSGKAGAGRPIPGFAASGGLRDNGDKPNSRPLQPPAR